MDEQHYQAPAAGWQAQANSWVKDTLNSAHYTQTGKHEVIEDWMLGEVWRIPTNRGTVYFKATHPLPLFSNEATLCQYLSQLFTEHVPEIIGLEPDEGWFLTVDFGETLFETITREDWAASYRLWGQLQKQSEAYTAQLSRSGCAYRSIAKLSEQLYWHLNHPKINAIVEAKGIVVSAKLYSKLNSRIELLCACELPECLVHGDLHKGNMAKTADAYLFFDWSDACISHPFMEGQFVYRFAESKDKRTLVEGYLSNWCDELSMDELLEAWRLAEPVCYAHHVVTYASFVLCQTDEDIFGVDVTSYLAALIEVL